MAVLSPAEDLRDSVPNLYFRTKYIDSQCFFSMPAKGIVFSRYTTNSNVCSRNLQISVRGFIHKINGNTNSNEKFRKHERDSLLTVAALACVAWRFWLGALSNKGGRGQRNREEIGAASPLLRPAQQNRHATRAIAAQNGLKSNTFILLLIHSILF